MTAFGTLTYGLMIQHYKIAIILLYGQAEVGDSMAPAGDGRPLCLDHAENRARRLFEAKFRYNFNERFAADLLQMQPNGYNVINVRLSRAASDVEHYGWEFC